MATNTHHTAGSGKFDSGPCKQYDWVKFYQWIGDPADPRCGYCSLDGTVAIGELVSAVGISLESTSLAVCLAADSSGNGAVTIDELIAATHSAVAGCGD